MGRVLVQQPGTNTAKALTETLPKNVIIVDEDLKELRLHDGVTPGGKIIGQSAGSRVPIGTIIPFAGNSVPQGYLLCDGSAISRTDYASLFAVIGTIYGAGDGNSTFNIPNFSYKQIGSSIACKGDGKIMGCMDGNGKVFGLSGWDSNVAYLSRDTSLYGKTLPSGRTSYFTGTSGIGLTTDKSKSGIVADTSNIPGCGMVIKYNR